MKKTTQLKNMLNSQELEFIMEAHNGISAVIAEEAGFRGIWGSGLSLSAAMGVRDNNEASWTQVLEVLEFMSDKTSIPILLDGDTGYGNFNNMRRLVKKLEQRDIAGVAIEDKLFPKTNSFIDGETQPLADIEEFCGKIKAAKDTQADKDFCVIARTEAFIAGWGLSEAIRRAEAYRQAGADAILVHSKKSDPSDIEMFMREWGNRHPVVIVPTKFYSTPTENFKQMGISLVIWANHNIRSSIKTMQETCKTIFEDKSLINVEKKCVSVSEIFRLQGANELKEAEKKYLPTSGKKVSAIVLAASQGSLGELVKDIPKTLLKVNGKSILSTIVDELNKVGIKDVSVVRGFAKEKVVLSNIKTVDNDDYAQTKDLYSLYLARDAFQDYTIVSFGDIVFKNYILNDLLNDDNDITIIVDTQFTMEGKDKDFTKTSRPYSRELYLESKPIELVELSNEFKKDEINGEFIGLWKFNKHGGELIKKTLDEMAKRADFKSLHVIDLLNEVKKKQPVAVKFIQGNWLDVDTFVDLQKAGEI